MTTTPTTEPVAAPPRGDSEFAAGMLVLATVLWGLSFPLVKNWHQATTPCPGGEVVGSLTLIILRTLLALPLLALARPGLFTRATRREFALGCVLGLLQCAGMALQTVGLARTTPALSGFFTSLASAWVPPLAWVLFRTRFSRATLIGIMLGVAGAGALGLDFSAGVALGGGEALTLASSLVFGVMILLLDRFGRSVRSAHLTVGFTLMTGLPAVPVLLLLAAGGPGLAPWAEWLGGAARNPVVVRDVVLVTALSTVGAMLLMTTYQPRVSAGRAALIYLLEPVFAAAFSLLWGHDFLTWHLIIGGGLILGGNLLVELPAWRRARNDPGERGA